MTRHRSSATPLALLYAALIVYASLYPFSGWRDTGAAPWTFLALPWPRYWTGFDLLFNLLGYIPLGALVAGALRRSGVNARASLAAGALSGAVLAALMEALQSYMPSRVPSNVDWALNALGALAGALLAMVVEAMGLIDRWQQVRDRWFIDRSAGGLALVLLWPLALLFPTPVPLGLGHVAARLETALSEQLQGTPLEGWIEPAGVAASRPLAPGLEFLAIACGLLVPCLLAFAVSHVSWRRLVLVVGAALLGWGATTLSTTLNFGPVHALAWVTAPALLAWLTAMVLGVLLAVVSARAAAALGLVLVTTLVSIVNQAPSDPYFAQSLLSWEQGRFIRFHGVAQWLGWLWPYATLMYLLLRVAARDARLQ